MKLLSAIGSWWSNVTLKSRLTKTARKFDRAVVNVEQTTWMNLDRSQSYRVTEIGRIDIGEKKIVAAVIVLGDDGQRYWIRCNRIDGTVPEEFCVKGTLVPKLQTT